jgi:anthranilate phosphoribosyltransferase
MIREILERVVSGELLDRDDAGALVRAIMQGEGNEIEIAGLLAALRTRGETVDEVVGAVRTLRELALELPEAPDGAVDTCGTGGDRSFSFNISTVSALVAAGAGVPVAKHGNRAASSRCGSADLFEALGVDLAAPPDLMAQCVHEVGIGFLFARACHPLLARVAPIRSALGVRTIFNRVAPLANPMNVRRQVVGVADPSHLEPTLQALVELGSECVWVVHGEDGLDEISLCAPTRVVAWRDGERRSFTIRPTEYITGGRAEDLLGGDAERNAEIARAILAGEKGPRRDVVLLNAAAALHVSGVAADLHEGIRGAVESIDSGRAQRVLERFISCTRGEEPVA